MGEKRTFRKEQQEQKNKKQYEWEAKKKEQFRIVMDKGTKARLKAVLMGKETVHGFMVRAILEEIRKRESLKYSNVQQEPEKPIIKEIRQQEPPNGPVSADMLKLASLGVKKGFSEDIYIPDGIEDYVENELEYDKTDPTAPSVPWD